MNEPVEVCPTCGGSGVVGRGRIGAGDQTLADRDQTASDQDQTWSDRDQTSSERDERSAADDQEAADRGMAAGGDSAVYRRTRIARERSGEDRHAVADLRDETATARLETAAERDRVAEQRDREAPERERAAAEPERHSGSNVEERFLHAERDRMKAAEDRARAAEDRAASAVDRVRAAQERGEAFRAEADARHELLVAGTDELTGAYTRRVGLAKINREIERAQRTGGSLILIFADVDGFKELNNSEGHSSGDKLLCLFVETLRANIRPYDIVVRYGGDEFLCAMPCLTLGAARARMEDVSAALTERDARHSIRFGLAQYEPPEQLDTLIGRADAELLDARGSVDA